MIETNNTNTNNTMKIEIETTSYNNRRYGKPWIAKVSFEDSKGEFHWGNWIGSPGEEGILVVEVEAGDIIARGQKDFRGASYKSAPDWYAVTTDGELERLPSRAAAYKAWRNANTLEVA